MGTGMAANLLKAGHGVTVYNRTGSKVEALVVQGSKAAADKLNVITTNNAKSPDRDKAAGDTALKTVMSRLYARGG